MIITRIVSWTIDLKSLNVSGMLQSKYHQPDNRPFLCGFIEIIGFKMTCFYIL